MVTMALLKNNIVHLRQCCRAYSALNRILDKGLNLNNSASILTNTQRWLFWEKERKGGYNTKEEVSTLTHLKTGYKDLKSEVKLWMQEIKELAVTDPLLIARPGETDLVWCFNSPQVLEKFVTTSDSDHNEGFSSCSLEMSRASRALFHGHLDTRVPKDGKIKKAGYCSLRSQRARKSFKRESSFDWHLYNTLVIKVRGDGRSYLLNLSCEGYYDITWNDIYHYVLYTRGGPYWQIAKRILDALECMEIIRYNTMGSIINEQIPFSKFILGSKGRLQDKQVRMRLDRVTHFGITCCDKINGEFNLEIEYIGLEFDPTHDEEFAYEMYKTERYIVGV